MQDNQLPPQVPDYDLVRPIGEGGFGRVWLGANQTTGRLRAVKLIPLRRSGTADAAGREIMSLTRLEANLAHRHPNLLSVHHVGKTSEYLFYVMDLADDISGRPASDDPDYEPATLQKRLESGPLDAETCFSCARQLLAGLSSLHEAGMVHRDVKPANCLFVGGELRLADFSLLTEASPLVSRVGTQKYMPPDGHMDARADVYAAGLLIYEMLTGMPADRFPSLGDTARDIVNNPFSSILMQLALRACEGDPQRRFRNAREMFQELKEPDRRAAGRRSGFSRAQKICLACVMVLLLGAIGLWLIRPHRVAVNFITYPFEATIYLDDVIQRDASGNPYRTPCTIDDLRAGAHRVIFKHENLGALDAGLQDFTKQQRIEKRWKSEIGGDIPVDR